jgi:lauroyl/myristoyl acyltransferase
MILMIPRVMDAIALSLLNMMRFLARYLSPRMLGTMIDYFGYALYYILKGAREYLLKTIQEALPDLSDERELKRIARTAFGAPFKAILDLVLMERHGERIMDNLVMAEGSHTRFDEAVAAGKGLILLSPHIGGASIITSVSTRVGKLFTPLVLSPARTPFPRFLIRICEIAESCGCDPENPVFWTGRETIPKVQEHLKRGESVGITFDMVGGTVMDFFGQPTAVASGIAHFACDSGAPILAYYLKRREDPLTYELIYCGELSYELTGDRSNDVRTILAAVLKKGEEIIKEAPDQWIIWFGLRSWRQRAKRIIQEGEK